MEQLEPRTFEVDIMLVCYWQYVITFICLYCFDQSTLWIFKVDFDPEYDQWSNSTRYIKSSTHPVPGTGRVIFPWLRTA